MEHRTQTHRRRGSMARYCAPRQAWGSVAVLAAVLLLPLRVGALGTGDLDTSFGGTGQVTTDFGGNRANRAAAVALQPDRKIVVAGSAVNSGNTSDFAVARYTPNGTLDRSFSENGTVTTTFGYQEYATSVALQPDGKIVVAGYAQTVSGRQAFALVRYLPNGALDLSFDGDGKVRTNFSQSSSDVASAVAIQPDGKIVVVGESADFSVRRHSAFAVVRYNADGTLDTRFGRGGKVLTDFEGTPGNPSGGGAGPFRHNAATALALQPDGKIIVAGYASDDSGNTAFAVARYTPNGTLDTTFSGDGRASICVDGIDLCELVDIAHAVALQADGKIVVAGVSVFDVTAEVFLVRFTANGTPDAAFGGTGIVTTSVCGDDAAVALALQLDGKIVVTGRSRLGVSSGLCPGNVFLARYTPHGTLDTMFSGDGKAFTSFGEPFPKNGPASALAIQPHNGRLVVVGWSQASFASPADFALARFHAHTCNGVVVTRIGTNGNDVLMGTSGTDVIYAFGGDDVVDGLGGNDSLCGGSGNDTLRGGDGHDILRGETGTDRLEGGAGTDRCDGGLGSEDTATTCETRLNLP